MFHDSISSIDKDYGEIRGRRASDHVARVLNVTRSIRNDELTLGGSKIAIGNVDSNSLLALSPKSAPPLALWERNAAVARFAGGREYEAPEWRASERARQEGSPE